MTARRPSKPLSGIHAKCCALNVEDLTVLVCGKSKGHDKPGASVERCRHYDPDRDTYWST